jgi:hypothetical protein
MIYFVYMFWNVYIVEWLNQGHQYINLLMYLSFFVMRTLIIYTSSNFREYIIIINCSHQIVQ